ncbi:hypothetical protein PsorP6_009033 [Peronosclerospora sorghi]|uniref:Uncharacterized protein n=1 Tax=Peronosclerospora sorghi TaxID=230839 RepID=A0ACC0VZZ5_9STRA|nr:hypothetical protein PsorP6_009033 [Peronosclerospora sorghi]
MQKENEELRTRVPARERARDEALAAFHSHDMWLQEAKGLHQMIQREFVQTALPAVTDKESSAERCYELTDIETYLMSSLYVHYAHVRCKIESTMLSADIDAATQEINLICSDATVDAAAVASMILAKTVQQRYLICCRYRDLFKQSLTECVKNTSEYGVLLRMLSTTLE